MSWRNVSMPGNKITNTVVHIGRSRGGTSRMGNKSRLTAPTDRTATPSTKARTKRRGLAREDGKTPTEKSDVEVEISRYIDWYAKNRHLPQSIALFLDTRWRSYVIRRYELDEWGRGNWRDAISLIKDLAWSVRPKRETMSRRRLIAMIPQLYERLHAGLDFVGVPPAEHEAFFAELTKLHQRALGAEDDVGELFSRDGAEKQ